VGHRAGVLKPFTTAQAADVGLTEARLRTAAVRREHHGVYVESFLEPSVDLSLHAAQLVLPDDALVDGVSALHALGVGVGDPWPLRFVSAHPHQVRRPGIRVRRARLLPPAVADASCVAPAAAFISAAQELNLVDLVAAGDWLVRLGRASPSELVHATATHRGRGAVLARRAAALVRERVDSMQETRLRLCLVLAGLPEPSVNPVVFVGGRALGRVDLFWARWRIALEYEGDQHRTDPRQWNVDIRRYEQLAADGCPVVRVTAERMHHPRAVIALVVKALRTAGWEGDGPVFNEEWHQLFPTAR
jgi:hypothetical protein